MTLQRLSLLHTLSSLRNIKSPTETSSANKLTTKRHLHPSTIGGICVVETREGPNVGLIKSLAMMGNISVTNDSLHHIIRQRWKQKLVNVLEIDSANYKYYTRVQLNGEVLGLTKDPNTIYKELLKEK